jgi:periplasmic divalent cation tolerance protein
MTDKIVVLTSCDSEARAEKLAHHLIETRVAACVNILPKARSIYRWSEASGLDHKRADDKRADDKKADEKIVDSSEWLLLIKSRRDRFPALRAEIEKVHSYEVPEIIALPIVDGSEAYLNWLDGELSNGVGN